MNKEEFLTEITKFCIKHGCEICITEHIPTPGCLEIQIAKGFKGVVMDIPECDDYSLYIPDFVEKIYYLVGNEELSWD